jgi:ketosteroid isomerase-like protein
MYSRIIGWYVRRQVGHLLAGDVDGTVRQFSDDGEMVFPGRSSFGGTFRGKTEIAGWLRRFVSLKPGYVIHDVLVAGPPWNLRVAYRLSDRIGEHYANEGMLYLRFRGMKAVHERVFLDTERVAEWERDHPEETGRDQVGTGSRALVG